MFTQLIPYWPLLFLVLIPLAFSGFVRISENQVGIVIQKFSSRSLGEGHFVALNVRAAQVQSARFLATHAQSGIAHLDPP